MPTWRASRASAKRRSSPTRSSPDCDTKRPASGCIRAVARYVGAMDPKLSLPRDEAALVEAVQAANLPTLMMVVVQLTGSAEILRRIRPQRAAPQRPDGG